MGTWLKRTAAAYRAQAHALRRWRPTPLGLAIRVGLSIISAWLSLLITIALAPGIDRDPGTYGILAVALIGAADFLIRPLILAAVLPIGLIAVMVAGLLYRALSFFFILPLVGFDLGGLGSALVGAGIYAVISTIFGGLVGMTDEESFGQRVVNQVIRDMERVPPTNIPGVVVIQIDGLPFPLLQAQVRAGTVTTLSRWIRSGTHRMVEWTAQLPSQTSTSQAGLLHGNNDGIPAFRWYEKERRKMMVSNKPPDAAEIESRISDGNGLLANGVLVCCGIARRAGGAEDRDFALRAIGGENRERPPQLAERLAENLQVFVRRALDRQLIGRVPQSPNEIGNLLTVFRAVAIEERSARYRSRATSSAS